MEQTNVQKSKVPLNLHNKNIGRGFHIAVKEWIPDEEEVYQEFLGHNRYSPFNPEPEVYWVRFKKSMEEAFFKRNTAESGLPYCLMELVFQSNMLEVYERLCPSLKTDDTAQRGMTEKFLIDLGIYDPRFTEKDVALRFYVTIVY